MDLEDAFTRAPSKILQLNTKLRDLKIQNFQYGLHQLNKGSHKSKKYSHSNKLTNNNNPNI